MIGPWKSQPCKLDELATLLNEIDKDGREVFQVIALGNGHGIVVSKARLAQGESEFKNSQKKGRKV